MVTGGIPEFASYTLRDLNYQELNFLEMVLTQWVHQNDCFGALKRVKL